MKGTRRPLVFLLVNREEALAEGYEIAANLRAFARLSLGINNTYMAPEKVRARTKRCLR
jgi:outer membrane receptor for ferrienterochelin and colicin